MSRFSSSSPSSSRILNCCCHTLTAQPKKYFATSSCSPENVSIASLRRASSFSSQYSTGRGGGRNVLTMEKKSVLLLKPFKAYRGLTVLSVNQQQRRSFWGLSSIWPSSKSSPNSNISSTNPSNTNGTEDIMNASFDKNSTMLDPASNAAGLPGIHSSTSFSSSTFPDHPIIDSTLSSSSPLIADTSSASTTMTNLSPEMVENATHLIEKLGDLKALGGFCSPYTPSGIVESFTEFTHVILLGADSPWFVTIIVATILLRIPFFYFGLQTQRNVVKMNNVKHLMDPIKARIAACEKNGDKIGKTKENMKLMQVFKDNEINPLVGLLAFPQIIFFIAQFVSCRKMAEYPVPGFSDGGFLWLTDLTIPDPYWILPVVAVFASFIPFLANKAASEGMTPGMKKGMMYLLPFSAVIFGQLPVAVVIYGITAGLMTLIQTLIFQIPAVKTYFGLVSTTGPSAPMTGMMAIEPLRYLESYHFVNDFRRRQEERRRKTGHWKEVAMPVSLSGSVEGPTKGKNFPSSPSKILDVEPSSTIKPFQSGSTSPKLPRNKSRTI